MRERLIELAAKAGPLNGEPLDLAGIVAGGNGYGGGTPGHGIDVLNGQPAAEPAARIAVIPNKFVAANHPFVHGVVIPDGGADGETPVPIAANGLAAAMPGTSGQTWDHIRSGRISSQGTSVVDNIDYAADPHTMLGLHANKAITFDLAAIRRATGYGELRFRAKACYGGQAEPTADYAVLVDGKPAVERRAITRQAQEIDVSLKADSRFLTLVATDQNRDIAHDQVFFGDAVVEPVGFKVPAEAELLAREKEALEKRIAQYPMLGADGKMNFDMTSLELVPDKTVRPDGLALEVRAWGPAADRTKPAEVKLLLTEFVDPLGEMTYFPVDETQEGVEDELYASE